MPEDQENQLPGENNQDLLTQKPEELAAIRIGTIADQIIESMMKNYFKSKRQRRSVQEIEEQNIYIRADFTSTHANQPNPLVDIDYYSETIIMDQENKTNHIYLIYHPYGLHSGFPGHGPIATNYGLTIDTKNPRLEDEAFTVYSREHKRTPETKFTAVKYFFNGNVEGNQVIKEFEFDRKNSGGLIGVQTPMEPGDYELCGRALSEILNTINPQTPQTPEP